MLLVSTLQQAPALNAADILDCLAGWLAAAARQDAAMLRSIHTVYIGIPNISFKHLHPANRAPTSTDQAATRPPNAHALRPRCNSVYPIGTNWNQLDHSSPISRDTFRQVGTSLPNRLALRP